MFMKLLVFAMRPVDDLQSHIGSASVLKKQKKGCIRLSVRVKQSRETVQPLPRGYFALKLALSCSAASCFPPKFFPCRTVAVVVEVNHKEVFLLFNVRHSGFSQVTTARRRRVMEERPLLRGRILCRPVWRRWSAIFCSRTSSHPHAKKLPLFLQRYFFSSHNIIRPPPRRSQNG